MTVQAVEKANLRCDTNRNERVFNPLVSICITRQQA